MKNIFIFVLFINLISFSPLFSQENEHQTEIDSSVPELFEFHDVIYAIWHTAYPEKDYAMLKELIPDVNAGAEKIYSVHLPGILHDKQTKWDEGVKKFRTSVEKYNQSIEENNETEMLNGAEMLHADFEMLVRIIKPVTKEVNEFHKVLYVIYHHYWPNKNMEAFGNAVNDLAMRAEELNNCVLPQWASEKNEVFKENSQKLYDAVKTLKELKDKNADDSEIETAIEKVHNSYVSIEELF